MLGYVHLLPETRPALERRTVAGTALWVLEGDPVSYTHLTLPTKA